MTETHNVSIEEVRALVTERQRYDDWLVALDERRAETPVRVFERVQNDYSARRRDVINRLREHVGGLARLNTDLDKRLASLASRLDTLEDERAEAMLRTAVGEFDSSRWEQVRQDVEAQIAQLAEERMALQAEGDEARTLLTSARAEPEAGESVSETAHPMSHATDTVAATMAPQEREAPAIANATQNSAPPVAVSAGDELAELDDALSIFSHNAPIESFGATTGSTITAPLLDVFDDSELGDLRTEPKAQATATATPSEGNRNVTDATSAASAPDGFDDLAFLRSVVDPSAPSGMARPSDSGTQQKTLRCTECSTMNLPTEWYCERCGGELAAF